MTYADPINLTTVPLLLEYANSVSDGYLGSGLLIALYAIVFINLQLRGNPAADSLVVAGWICLIPGVFFFLLGLLSNAQLFIVIMVLAIPLLYSFLNKEN